MLSELVEIGKQEREKHLWFGLYLWEKSKKKYWPMDNEVFDDVKKFLKAL